MNEHTVLTEQEYRRMQIERMCAEAAAQDSYHNQEVARHRANSAALSLAVQMTIVRMMTDAMLGAGGYS